MKRKWAFPANGAQSCSSKVDHRLLQEVFKQQKFTTHFEPYLFILEAILSGTQIDKVWPGFQKTRSAAVKQ